MDSFSNLLKLHEELDHAFAQHQYALLRFEFDLAFGLLQQYGSALRDHMSDEEDLLLPLYSERAAIRTGGAVDLFLSEHQKMLEWLEVFADATERLKTENEPEPMLITLLDRESFYKKLCTHHDIRESKHLYPALDEATTEAERSELVRRLRWKPAHSSNEEKGQGLRDPSKALLNLFPIVRIDE